MLGPQLVVLFQGGYAGGALQEEVWHRGWALAVFSPTPIPFAAPAACCHDLLAIMDPPSGTIYQNKLYFCKSLLVMVFHCGNKKITAPGDIDFRSKQHLAVGTVVKKLLSAAV